MIHGTRRLRQFFFIVVGASSTWAANLNVSVTSGGDESINVAAGALVNYEVTGVLTDDLNEGLAVVFFDLSFDGGPLSPGAVPAVPPMNNFVRPLGLTNPAGYPGTVIGGALVQCGGAQNTIKNDGQVIPFPSGTVITGVGHTEVVVATGTLTAPPTTGSFSLTVTDASAAVIRKGETGEPFGIPIRSC